MLSEDSVDALLNDSDTEDDALLAQSIDASSEHLCQLIELHALLNKSFWKRAINSSQRRRGFREELITFSESVSPANPIKPLFLTRLNAYVDLLWSITRAMCD